MTMSNASPAPAVLIVEDEPLVRLLAVDIVEGMGVAALEASDAEEALAMLQAHPEVAVLFTDVDMPGSMNGLRLAACVHERSPAIAIIVTSGKSLHSDAALPENSTFLPKPYHVAELTALLCGKLKAAGMLA